MTFRYQGVRPPIVARVDVPHASSDGGLLLLKAVDERLQLTETVAVSLTDPRQPGKGAHSLLDLVRQRVFGLAAGYLDGYDAARLADEEERHAEAICGSVASPGALSRLPF